MDEMRIRAAAAETKAWAGAREFIADLERIARNGPEPTEYDERIMRMACCLVMARLKTTAK